MSRESMEWLNTRTLIGFTDQRGNAWHYAETLQGDEPNHYPGPIPVGDVRRRLFGFTVEPRDVLVRVEEDSPVAVVPNRKAWIATDTGEVLGIFTDGYQGHQYDEWLTRNVESILDGELGIGSAGLLKNRAQAWVAVEVPESIETPEGVTFRPRLIAATSFDGSLATTYKRSAQVVVCDNTLAAGLSGAGERYRLKHTRYSNLRIGEAREALAVVFTMAEDFAAEVKRLCDIEVPDKAFGGVLDILVPLTDSHGQPFKGRSLTTAERKRGEVTRLYRHDDRAAPWAGTAYGVLAAFNTYGHHYGTIRNASRVQRNASNMVTGAVEGTDAAVLAAVDAVLAAA